MSDFQNMLQKLDEINEKITKSVDEKEIDRLSDSAIKRLACGGCYGTQISCKIVQS